MIHLGPKFNIDLRSLMETRLLVQANSGGGKSYFLRKLLEQTHGKVQHIVLDMEGEFSTLRAKYDYVLAGKDGDVAADPYTAGLLARKMLELRTSVIIDLYELHQDDRILFVSRFLDAMMNAPKNLWHPVLVVLDEAHVFAPETGKSAAMREVIDLATRGRKRGFSLIAATQRLSKLHKDVAAECINKVIGRTGLDIDMKRAGDELGFATKKDIELRELAPGAFYAFGPAIARAPTIVKVDPVQTKHPKAGQRIRSVKPRPTHKIAAALKKLTDLPAKAEEELHTIEDYQARIRELEKEAKTMKEPKPAKVSKAELAAAVKQAENRLRKQFAKDLGEVVEHVKKSMAAAAQAVQADLTAALPKLRAYHLNPSEVESFLGIDPQKAIATLGHKAAPKLAAPKNDGSFLKLAKRADIEDADRYSEARASETPSMGRCERAILAFLVRYPDRTFSRVQIGAMSGYSPNSSGFNNAMSKLRTSGFIQGTGDSIRLIQDRATDADKLAAGMPEFRFEEWANKLPKCERAIYQIAASDPNVELSRAELAERSGYSSNSSGFNNALSHLRSIGLIEGYHGQGIRLNRALVQVLS